jgi:hypothetical protein
MLDRQFSLLKLHVGNLSAVDVNVSQWCTVVKKRLQHQFNPYDPPLPSSPMSWNCFALTI